MFPRRRVDPKQGYDFWAKNYDDQPYNLMFRLDELIFRDLLGKLDLKDKNIVDFGCGTGRHWKAILEKGPCELVGYDISEAMLSFVREKYPGAKVYVSADNTIRQSTEDSVDVIISTLTITHVKNLKFLFDKWDRALKKDGMVLITDYHADAIKKGGNRSFPHNGITLSLQIYEHPLDKIIAGARQLGWELNTIVEKAIGEDERPFYERLNAMHTFENFKGVNVIYGVLLQKKK